MCVHTRFGPYCVGKVGTGAGAYARASTPKKGKAQAHTPTPSPKTPQPQAQTPAPSRSTPGCSRAKTRHKHTSHAWATATHVASPKTPRPQAQTPAPRRTPECFRTKTRRMCTSHAWTTMASAGFVLVWPRLVRFFYPEKIGAGGSHLSDFRRSRPGRTHRSLGCFHRVRLGWYLFNQAFVVSPTINKAQAQVPRLGHCHKCLFLRCTMCGNSCSRRTGGSHCRMPVRHVACGTPRVKVILACYGSLRPTPRLGSAGHTEGTCPRASGAVLRCVWSLLRCRFRPRHLWDWPEGMDF